MCSLGSSEHLGCGFQVSVCGVELLGEAGTFSMKAFGGGKSANCDGNSVPMAQLSVFKALCHASPPSNLQRLKTSHYD